MSQDRPPTDGSVRQAALVHAAQPRAVRAGAQKNGDAEHRQVVPMVEQEIIPREALAEHGVSRRLELEVSDPGTRTVYLEDAVDGRRDGGDVGVERRQRMLDGHPGQREPGFGAGFQEGLGGCVEAFRQGCRSPPRVGVRSSGVRSVRPLPPDAGSRRSTQRG